MQHLRVRGTGVERDQAHVAGAHRVVRNAAWRDGHRIAGAHADVAGGVDDEPAFGHSPGGVDDSLALGFQPHRPTPCLAVERLRSSAVEGHRFIAAGYRRRALDQADGKVCVSASENAQRLPHDFRPLNHNLLRTQQAFESRVSYFYVGRNKPVFFANAGGIMRPTDYSEYCSVTRRQLLRSLGAAGFDEAPHHAFD